MNCQLTHKIKCQLEIKTSNIKGAGKGGFLAAHSRSLAPGECVGEYTGELMSTNRCEFLGLGYREHRKSFVFKSTEETVIDANSAGALVSQYCVFCNDVSDLIIHPLL
jgi:hypothetical protein